MNWALMAAEATGGVGLACWLSHRRSVRGPISELDAYARQVSMIEAVLFDFGGVVLTSPFDAFARYEVEAGLPPHTIRGINATNPDTNAWALFERREVDVEGFCLLFEAEAAELGLVLDAQRVLASLHGELRPAMVDAVRRCSDELRTGLLTNNVTPLADQESARPEVLSVVALFDVVVESSLVGCRKPEPEFYELACTLLGVEPSRCVFLDDLGINLKPARSMGMTTIKVGDPAAAIEELEAVLGFPLG